MNAFGRRAFVLAGLATTGAVALTAYPFTLGVASAYGRTNAGTARGDRDLAHRFLGGFFRI
jgi:hypothetical protein